MDALPPNQELPPGPCFPILARMQIKSAEFITSACGLADCPAWELPEFAFIGRSNVGKSSMINMLSNKHALAKVSATPGKTRLLNFFLMNDRWSLVDLPGYGFARTGRPCSARASRPGLPCFAPAAFVVRNRLHF